MEVIYHLDANDNIVGKTVDQEYIDSKNGFANFMTFLGWAIVAFLGALGLLGVAGFALYVGLCMLADILR